MLMKRTRAHSSSCSQYSLGLSSFMSSQFIFLQPKIDKKSVKIDIFGFKIIQGYRY